MLSKIKITGEILGWFVFVVAVISLIALVFWLFGLTSSSGDDSANDNKSNLYVKNGETFQDGKNGDKSKLVDSGPRCSVFDTSTDNWKGWCGSKSDKCYNYNEWQEDASLKLDKCPTDGPNAVCKREGDMCMPINQDSKCWKFNNEGECNNNDSCQWQKPLECRSKNISDNGKKCWEHKDKDSCPTNCKWKSESWGGYCTDPCTNIPYLDQDDYKARCLAMQEESSPQPADGSNSGGSIGDGGEVEGNTLSPISEEEEEGTSSLPSHILDVSPRQIPIPSEIPDVNFDIVDITPSTTSKDMTQNKTESKNKIKPQNKNEDMPKNSTVTTNMQPNINPNKMHDSEDIGLGTTPPPIDIEGNMASGPIISPGQKEPSFSHVETSVPDHGIVRTPSNMQHMTPPMQHAYHQQGYLQAPVGKGAAQQRGIPSAPPNWPLMDLDRFPYNGCRADGRGPGCQPGWVLTKDKETGKRNQYNIDAIGNILVSANDGVMNIMYPHISTN